MTFDPARVYRPRQVASRSGVPRGKVYEDLHSSKLPSLRRGRNYLIPGWAIAPWIRTLAGSGVTPVEAEPDQGAGGTP